MPARRVVLATGNAGKLGEMRAILAGHGLEVVAQSEFGIQPPIEDGESFVANALIKARHAAKIARLPAIADDSGIEVDALGGRDRRARDDEERVVAETARAASFEADLAFPGRLRDDRRRIPGFTHEHHRTAVARAPASGRNARKLRKKFFVVRTLVGFGSRVARRVDARAAAERVHLDA